MPAVIKNISAPRAPQQVAFNLEDLTIQAKQYLEQMRIQAAQLVVEAQKQADLLKARAQAEGRQEAERAAEKILDEKITKRLETLLPALQQVIRDLHDAKQNWLRHGEQTTVELAAKIAAKILRDELTRRPELPLKLVREALELAAGTTQVRIALNPVDHTALTGQLESLVKEFGKIAQAEFIADPTINAGGCRVNTEQGVIDQTYAAQLERIVAELTSSNAD